MYHLLQQVPHVLLHVLSTPETNEHRRVLLATHLQYLLTFLPLTVALNRSGESTQLEHVPHVEGQCSDTPLVLQRLVLLAAQRHDLMMYRPL